MTELEQVLISAREALAEAAEQTRDVDHPLTEYIALANKTMASIDRQIREAGEFDLLDLQTIVACTNEMNRLLEKK